MKKIIFGALAFAVAMASCNNASPKMDEKPQATGSENVSGMKIAYVEVDSLMTQYDFAKDYSVTLQKKSNNARNTLTQKGNQLQTAVNNFQQRLQSNGFQSREQARAFRQPLSVSSATFRSCRLVWKVNWLTRPRSSMRHYATR